MFFIREKKKDTSNRNRERCFFTCEKNGTFNQKPQMCVSFASKFPPFIGAFSMQRPRFANIQRETTIKQSFYRRKVKKHLGNWIEIILYLYTKNSTLDEEN